MDSKQSIFENKKYLILSILINELKIYFPINQNLLLTDSHEYNLFEDNYQVNS